MEKWIKNIFSLVIIGVFALMALACDDEGGAPDPKNCDDPLLYEKEPLTPKVTSPIYFNLTLLDKQTNLPVSGIYVKAHWTFATCQKEDGCPEKCGMYVSFWEDNAAEYSTNASGNIDGQTLPFTFEDKKDRFLVAFDIEDLSGKYVPKRISFRYDYTTTSHSFTAYLLKNDDL